MRVTSDMANDYRRRMLPEVMCPNSQMGARVGPTHRSYVSLSPWILGICSMAARLSIADRAQNMHGKNRNWFDLIKLLETIESRKSFCDGGFSTYGEL